MTTLPGEYLLSNLHLILWDCSTTPKLRLSCDANCTAARVMNPLPVRIPSLTDWHTFYDNGKTSYQFLVGKNGPVHHQSGVAA